jgi:hypothetical protein
MQKAMLELLQDVSNILSGGKKVYNSMFTMDGLPLIDLNTIPIDCKLIVVSEKNLEQLIA